MPPPGIAAGPAFSGLSATSASVVSSRPAIDAAFCSAARVTLAGSMTPAFTQVLEVAGGGVEADVAGLALDPLDDDRALERRRSRRWPGRRLERLARRSGAGGLVALELLDDVGDRGPGPEQGGAAAGDDALLDGGPGGRDGVLDAVLLLLELDLGGRADLDDGDAAGELGQPLLQLLAVPVGVGVLDLALDLGDAALDVVLGAGALDDGGLVLGDDHLAGLTEQVERGAVELEADLLGDDLAAGEGGHVLQHRLAALAEAGGLDGDRVERAADLVDDEGGEGLALDVLGDDQQRACRPA